MNCELHNIAELDTNSNLPGPLVRRIPGAVANALETGALVAKDASLCELRFAVESGPRLSLTLTSVSGGDLFVYRGDLLQNHVRLPANALFSHVLDFQNDAFAAIRPEAFAGGRFSPAVWRVVFDGQTLLHGIDPMGCVIRPPRSEEKPQRRWLAYGSSITHGYTPVTRMQCYVAHAARLLGVDVLNMGLAGACRLEPGFADYLAARSDWDFITCELGVNVRNTMDPLEFERRARYLTERLIRQQPGKPVILISPFLSRADFEMEPGIAARNTAAYRAILQDLAAGYAASGVHYIDGREVLDQFSGLTCDLVHPSTEGHSRMAENLALRVSSILNS